MKNQLQSIHFVVVTYNGETFIKKCIAAIREESPASPIHVIDNGSHDNTLSILADLNITPIQTHENLGFGKANNIGISKALTSNASNVFLINQDAYLERGSLRRFFEKSESRQTALHAFIQLNGNGDKLDSNFKSNYLSHKNCPDFLEDLFFSTLQPSYEIAFANAAAWIMPRELLLKIGGFNPSFFHYGEDDNYINRLHHHDFKLILHPDCRVNHDREDRPKSSFFSDTKSKERLFLLRISHPSNQTNAKQLLRQSKRNFWKKRIRGHKREHIIESLHLDFLERNPVGDIIDNRNVTKTLGTHFLQLE